MSACLRADVLYASRSQNACDLLLDILMKRKNSDYDHEDHDCELLLQAANNGDVLGVQELLQKDSTDICNAKSHPTGDTPMHLACWSNRLPIIKLLLAEHYNEDGADNDHPLNVKNYLGDTPLHHASQRGHFEVIKFLIQNGGARGVNDRNDNGSTPLYLACLGCGGEYDDDDNYLETAKLLTDNGADVNLKNIRGDVPLHMAKNNLKILNLLVENGANINAKDNVRGHTPLNDACMTGHLEAAKLLIENGGADLNTKSNISGMAPLHFACEKGSLGMLRLLIDNGADLNIKDKNGETPLHLACKFDRFEIIKLLIDENNGKSATAKININIQNNDGKTPLYVACEYGRLEVVQLLLRRADIDTTKMTTNCSTPLQVASERNHLKVV